MSPLLPSFRQLAGMPDFHLTTIGKVGQLTVWEVNDKLIRDVLDIEFSNGAYHESRIYVPKDEIWIGRDAARSGDQKFWAYRQLSERFYRVEKGRSEDEAFDAAKKAEEEARGKKEGTPPRFLLDRLNAINGFEIWLVSGKAIRDWKYVDFTEGGNGFRYDWIPKNQIYIDDAIVPEEYQPTIIHEVAESLWMRDQGWAYEPAHEQANIAEKRFRQTHR